MATIWTDKKRSLFFGLPLSFTKYICTDEKFIVEAGMLSTREDEIRLYRILDLTLERSFMQRIFGLGTIKCDTMDKSMPKLEIKNIKKSRDVKEMISEAVEKERERVSSRVNMMSYGIDCDCDCDSDCYHVEDMDQ